MDPAIIGLLVTAVTIGVFALGIPVAFGLGFVAVTFLLAFEGFGMTKDVHARRAVRRVQIFIKAHEAEEIL